MIFSLQVICIVRDDSKDSPGLCRRHAPVWMRKIEKIPQLWMGKFSVQPRLYVLLAAEATLLAGWIDFRSRVYRLRSTRHESWAYFQMRVEDFFESLFADPIQQFQHFFALENQKTQPVVGDAVFKTVCITRDLVFHEGLEVLERDIIMTAEAVG